MPSDWSDEAEVLTGPPPLEVKMGTWTMIKLIAALVAMLAVGGTVGGYIWEYHHRGTVIEELKIENANLKIEKAVMEKQKKASDEFVGKKTTATRRVTNEQKQITQEVTTVPDSGMDALYDQFRLHPDGKVQPSTPGGKRRLKNTTPGSP